MLLCLPSALRFAALACALVMPAKARAEIKVAGDARMGLHQPYAANRPLFTSRVRIKFALSGTTDGGLSFGAQAGTESAGKAALGLAGVVFVEGGGWRVAMGDTGSAAAAAVGQVAVVGLTELGDLNNITYIANGGTAFVPGGGVTPAATADPSVLVTRTAEPFRYTFSLSNPSGATTAWAFGVDRKTDRLRLSAGVEGQAAGARAVAAGIAVIRGGLTLRAVAGVVRDKGASYRQGAVSARYSAGPLSVAVFATDDSALRLGASARAVGIGAAYGIGASLMLKGGAVRNLTTGRNSFDLGLAMTF